MVEIGSSKKQISKELCEWLVIPGSKALFSMRPGMGSGCRSVFPLDDPRHRVCWGQSAAPAVAVPNLLFAGNSPSAAATLSDHRRRCRSPTRLLPSYKGRTKGSSPLELKHMYLPCLPCARYRGGLQALLLQLRLMALGLLMFEQRVRGTIFPSAFLLQPNLVYCFPTRKDNGQFGCHGDTASILLLRLPVVQTSSTRFGTVGPSLQSPFIEYGIF